MRLKYQSLIALGISTVILSGCTSTGGGFLNLGVVDALRKSKANIFKQRLSYTKTPIGSTGLSLPTFGTQPTPGSGPVVIDSYSVPQSAPSMMQSAPSMMHSAPSMMQGTPAPLTSDCGCGAGESTVGSTQQFFMPIRESVEQPPMDHEVIQQPISELVSPPVDSAANPLPGVNVLPQVNDLPEVNALPVGNDNSKPEANKGNNFDNLDTEGTLEPLGQKDDDFELDSQEEIADGQRSKDQSIFEEAELIERTKIKFDAATSLSKNEVEVAEQKPEMLTLHARPAQSHNVYQQLANNPKSPETVQASHKPYYRQQNALRQQPTKLNDRGYRQARNTNGDVEFKPLPPVLETPPVPVITPKTKLVPLPTSNTNHGIQSDELQKSNTRTADATSNQTVNTTPRVPILRATTVSSASILSLKNLANVIDDTQNQKRFYQANSHTAQGTTSSSIEVLNSNEATVER